MFRTMHDDGKNHGGHIRPHTLLQPGLLLTMSRAPARLLCSTAASEPPILASASAHRAAVYADSACV